MLAGAPAFECRIGSTRIGLDTHRSVALVRQSVGPVVRFGLANVNADGANQRYRLTSGMSSSPHKFLRGHSGVSDVRQPAVSKVVCLDPGNRERYLGCNGGDFWSLPKFTGSQ